MNFQLMTTHKAHVWKSEKYPLWFGVCRADGCHWKYLSRNWTVCYLSARDHMIVRHAIHN